MKIKLIMHSLLAFIVLLSAPSLLKAHTHSVRNGTMGTILVRCWSAVGQKGEAYIKPGATEDINVGIYCIYKIGVLGVGLPINDLYAEYEIPTGRNICAGHSYLIRHVGAEQVPKQGGGVGSINIYNNPQQPMPAGANASDTDPSYFQLPYLLKGGYLQIIQTDQ